MEPGLFLIFAVFALGVITGVPVAFCLGIAAVVGFIYEGLNPAVAFQQMASGMSIFSLLAIPFFIFAGEIMLHGGIARRLIALAGLPTVGPVLSQSDNAGRYLELMRVDKKAEAGEIKFVVIDRPGSARVQSAPDALVRQVIDACCVPL